MSKEIIMTVMLKERPPEPNPIPCKWCGDTVEGWKVAQGRDECDNCVGLYTEVETNLELVKKMFPHINK
jgi:hypothetical protein